ncbi:MAG: YceI family protein [Bacteroidia bacterium]|nr:YceI family protein [Bacteroidia bacterium]
MKKVILSVATIATIGWNSIAQTTKWVIDKSHSKVQFDVAHLVISEVTGQFKSFDGSVLSDKPDFSDAKIEVSIDVNSINTDDEKRDGHLKSPDFFDANKYPKITFKSKSLKKVNNNLYKLTGDLTMHGVTKEVVLDVQFNGIKNDPWGNTKAGFKVTGKINRNDFGLKYNAPLEGGGVLIGEEVNITCNVELLKQK